MRLINPKAMPQPIPLVDLKKQYLSIKAELDAAMQEVLDNTAFVGDQGNRFVQQFQQEFADFLGVKHVIGCGNGTDSIEMLLRAYSIGPGDEVLVPAVSWISTSAAVTAVGAKPVFVDIEADNYCIDPSLIEAKISSATKAIIPVHLYGNMADMERIMRIANKHQLIVIEDCAQSHGAELNNKMAGTWGHAASFSFYPGKNLGAYGDGGAMATNDDAIAEQLTIIQNHGQAGKHNHVLEGRNSKLDGLQAAVLSVKLKHLKDWTDKRIWAAATYAKYLETTGLTVPLARSNAKHVFHLFVVQVADRDGLIDHLREQDIFAGIHYPVALPLLPAYQYQGHVASDFPVASSFTPRIVSLPLFPELTDEDIARVAKAVNAYITQPVS